MKIIIKNFLGIIGYLLLIAETIAYFCALRWLSDIRLLDYGRAEFADLTRNVMRNTGWVLLLLMLVSVILTVTAYTKHIPVNILSENSLTAIFFKGVTCIITIPTVCYVILDDGANTLDSFILFFIVHVIVGWLIHILATTLSIFKQLIPKRNSK